MKRVVRLLVLALVAACGTTAPDPNPPGLLPHGGTGEFRPMTDVETGIRGTPPGLSLASRNGAIESGRALLDGPLFYAFGPELEMPPDEDPTLPEGDVDWSGYEPRSIWRSPQREEELGFGVATEILSATEAWQMGEIYSPWPVRLEDGRVRLYYASPGGIGMAEAPSADGDFAPVGTGPIVAASGADAPRRPSVVSAPNGDGYMMYYELGDRIALATSADGLAFTTVTDDLDLGPFVPRDASDPAEIGVGGPGAVTVTTSVGRSLVRLYFESRREDGTRLIMMAGSTDGMTFTRYDIPVISDPDRRDPSPLLVDLRTTILHVHAPRTVGGRQGRGIIGTVAPRTVVLVEVPDADAGM